MLKYKKRIVQIAVILAVALLICTVLARSIDTLLLTQISTDTPQSGSLSYENKYDSVFVPSSEDFGAILAKNNYIISEVMVKTGDTVTKGDVLFQVDISGYLIQQKQLEASIQQQKNMINSSEFSSGDLLVENTRLSALEMQLTQLKSQYPKGGKISANTSGIVRLHAGEGNVIAGALLAEIEPLSDLSYISMQLYASDAEQYLSRSKTLTAEFLLPKDDSGEHGDKIECAAQAVAFEYSPDSKMYDIRLSIEQGGIAAGTPCTVTVKYSSEAYDTLLPVNCVTRDAAGSYIFELSTKNGVFGEEYYVSQKRINENETNHQYVASKETISPYTKLAVNPSRTLHDGDRVRVVE